MRIIPKGKLKDKILDWMSITGATCVGLLCISFTCWFICQIIGDARREKVQAKEEAKQKLLIKLPEINEGVYVVVIDNHEYIYINKRNGGLAHKGDCKFCKEKGEKQ